MFFPFTLRALLCLLFLPASVLAAGLVPTAAAFDPSVALRASQAVVGQSVADHILFDRAGRPVKLSSYRGKPLLVSFIY
ncbi:MAG: hypothetical protein NTY41_18005, partial [Proteobacteria bacterium]|nr:hypothetical protein [Pseudomonadota bacterium]